MKKFIALSFAAALLTGCASNGWQDYADTNNCVATGNTELKKEMQMASMAPGGSGGIGLGGSPAMVMPTMSVRKVYEYKCTNGVIWSYASKGASTQPREQVAAMAR